MSGGSMEYFYLKLMDVSFHHTNTPERKAFDAHLKKVADALHDIEWVDSGDYGPDQEVESIKACIGTHVIMRSQLEQIAKVLSKLQADIHAAEKNAEAMLNAAPLPAVDKRIDLYSELAEALGCDCMDSHPGRLNRAVRASAALEAMKPQDRDPCKVVACHPTLEECEAAGRGPGFTLGSVGGLPNTPEERTRFEAYMRGHCWDAGKYDEASQGYDTLLARMLYGIWRDRGSLCRCDAAPAPDHIPDATKMVPAPEPMSDERILEIAMEHHYNPVKFGRAILAAKGA